jgi:hypothetical protein
MGNVLHKDLTQESLHEPKYHANSHAVGGVDKITSLDNVTMTGSIGPIASGTLSIGTADKAFHEAHIDNLAVKEKIVAGEFYGDGSNLTGISASGAGGNGYFPQGW